MSGESHAADARELPATQAATQTKGPGSNRFAGLRLHLKNIYRLMIKELRSFRSDPIMLLLVAYSFTIAIYAAATGPKRPTCQLESAMKTIPIYPVALRMASPHRLSSQSYSSRRRTSTRQ